MEQPELPSEVVWSERTRAWWASLGSVPGVDGWNGADWQFALDTALLHDAVWNGGELKYLQELRQREQALGITPAAHGRSRRREGDGNAIAKDYGKAGGASWH